MLTQTLRSLEDDGIVNRKVYAVVPPMVEYSLTPLGRSLIEPLEAICRWAEEHLPELEAASERAKRANRRKLGLLDVDSAHWRLGRCRDNAGIN